MLGVCKCSVETRCASSLQHQYYNIKKTLFLHYFGQLVYTIQGKKINTKNFVIDLSDYKSGVYYLIIINNLSGILFLT